MQLSRPRSFPLDGYTHGIGGKEAAKDFNTVGRKGPCQASTGGTATGRVVVTSDSSLQR
jgi:hypothetical protein